MSLFKRKHEDNVSTPRKAIQKSSERSSGTAGQTDDPSAEFRRDIEILIAREDITNRSEICNAEYQKAQELLENPTSDSVHRAYDLMGNLATQFEYVPAIFWMGDFAETVMENDGQAVFWYKKAADLGDGNGARCYADMLCIGKGVEQDIRGAMLYYKQASDAGVAEASFALGELLRRCGDRENSFKAYQRAYAGGYEPGKVRMDQMKSGKI